MPRKATVREFKTGARRNPDEGKLNYTGFFHPAVTRRIAEYMHKHRTQEDGSLRAADNWQLGIPRQSYMESLDRHVQDVKFLHQVEKDQSTWDSARWGIKEVDPEEMLDLLSAIVFNAQGMMLEIMKGTEIEEAA